MKLIVKIAKNELRSLFYSPVAWFLLIVFLVLSAVFYAPAIYNLAVLDSRIIYPDDVLDVINQGGETWAFFSNPGGGFFGSLLNYLYLFPPLLTMAIVSREFNGGTIKLLYSSPLRLYQIVLGKYLALVIFNAVMMAVVGIFIVSAFFDFKAFEYLPVFTGLLGLYLFLCALTAIGFFMSALTRYPIVAAIASFVVLFLLTSIGSYWQQYDGIKDLTWFLSIQNRTEWLIKGLVRSRDIFYYLVIICMFLGFTILKLQAGRESKPWFLKAGKYALVLISGLLVGYLSSRQQVVAYWDSTAAKKNTIHPRTQQILKELNDGPLEITAYCNLFAPNISAFLPRANNEYLEMWEPYLRFKKDILFNYKYYYHIRPGDSSWFVKFPGKSLQQIAGLVARLYKIDSALFKPVDQVAGGADIDPEDFNLRFVQLKYKSRTALLRFLPSDYLSQTVVVSGRGQMMINAALKRVAGASIPRVGFVTGQLERNIHKLGEREYRDHARDKGGQQALINAGFDVDTLNLDYQDVPDNLTIMVLADPKMSFSSLVLQKINKFIANGGNMLILGEPGKQYVLNPVLKELGIQFRSGQLVRPDNNETPDFIVAEYTKNVYERGLMVDTSQRAVAELFAKYNNSSQFSLGGFNMRGAVAIEESKRDAAFRRDVIMQTESGKTWLKADVLVADSTLPPLDGGRGDIKEDRFPAMVTMTRMMNRREQRILVCGDADFLSNKQAYGLLEFVILPIYKWLCNDQFPILTKPPSTKDTRIRATPTRAFVQKIIYIWVMPSLLIAIGMILLIRRKRG